VSVKLMTAAWDTKLASVRKLVLLALCDNANDQGQCYPSVKTLEEKCSLSRRSIFQAISELEAAGFLIKDEIRAGRSTVYQITNPCTWRTSAVDALVHLPHHSGAEDAPPPVHVAHHSGAGGAPITINEPSIEPSVNHHWFENFWRAYPRKKSKGNAEKAFAKIRPNEQLLRQILAAIERAKTSADWQQEKYIPHPATWLNARGWEDVPMVSVSNSSSDRDRKRTEFLNELTGGNRDANTIDANSSWV